MRGSFRVLILYDVAEQIDLDRLRQLCGAEPSRREPSFRHPAPEYVKFERAPIVESATGREYRTTLKYFDYGVVSVELEEDFDTDWDELVKLSSRWIDRPDLEQLTSKLV